MNEPHLECIVCGEELAGRQRLYCSGRCKKRAQRHPDRYPKPDPPAPPRPTTAQDDVEETNTGDEGPARPRSAVAEAAATGDRAAILAALRDRLAKEIDYCYDPRALASLSARLVDVIDRTEPAKPAGKPNGGGALDQIAERRAAREARRQSTA